MTLDPNIFRSYDIRGIAGEQIDKDGIVRIAEAIVENFKPKSVQVGRDMRVTSEEYQKALIDTLLDHGVDVVDLGLISTDMLYYAAGTYDEGMAVTISASHNPPEYNGIKMVKKGAVAISGESGIYDLRDLATSDFKIKNTSDKKGELKTRDIMKGWIQHLLTFIDVDQMKSFKVVSDTGNGMAGHFMPHLEEELPWEVIRLYYDLDGSFPNHIPSPIEPKNMQDCIDAVKEHSADVGMAFDGDGDRVFLVDETGRIVSGTIMTAIIAENLLQKNKDNMILYNAIVGRVVPEIVEKYGGKFKRVKVGHTIIKAEMREEDAAFCGEHSGHYFFRENFYADSAIVAALLVLEMMSKKGKKLSELVDEYDKYPSTGEINFKVDNKEEMMKFIAMKYKGSANSFDELDGISLWYDDWWFNVRPSNTEPVLRLNIEADNQDLLSQKKDELISLMESNQAELQE